MRVLCGEEVIEVIEERWGLTLSRPGQGDALVLSRGAFRPTPSASANEEVQFSVR